MLLWTHGANTTFHSNARAETIATSRPRRYADGRHDHPVLLGERPGILRRHRRRCHGPALRPVLDASPSLASLAERHTGQPVRVLRLQDMEWSQTFDGIWACASLLHVPAAELPEVMGRLAGALRPGGVLYASFKYGHGERERQGRRFTDLDVAGLRALLAQVPGLTEPETWISQDLRPGRAAERWLNTLLAA